MPISSKLIDQIASYAADSGGIDHLRGEVIATAKEVMVNAAAAALAGAAQQEGQIVTRFVQDMGGNGRCTIIGRGVRTSPVYSALANGTLIHLLDFDEEITGNGAHPASAVFPVVMALGEMNGLPGHEVLAAFAAGCQVTSRLQSAPVGQQPEGGPDQMPAVSYGGVPDTLGAATAAALLLGLDRNQMAAALHLAATGAGPALPAFTAGPVRAHSQGRAAMTGIMAALLAHQGMQAIAGNPMADILIGQRTGSEGTIPGGKQEVDLGTSHDLTGSRLGLKLYPCASPSHTVIDAALQLVQQYRFSPADVADVFVGTSPSAMMALPFASPANGWEARACISYIVAATLSHGHPLIENFTDGAIADPQVRELMGRVTVEAATPSTVSIPYPASVAISLRDGRRLENRVEFARGLGELPLSTEEMDAKFLYCSRYILPPDHIEEAITRLRDLENIENTTGLFSVLGG